MERAKDYRRRAEQLRAIAEGSKDVEAQETLLEMAREYERMAEEREREVREANKKGGGKK